jgi:hypothetical protein
MRVSGSAAHGAAAQVATRVAAAPPQPLGAATVRGPPACTVAAPTIAALRLARRAGGHTAPSTIACRAAATAIGRALALTIGGAGISTGAGIAVIAGAIRQDRKDAGPVRAAHVRAEAITGRTLADIPAPSAVRGVDAHVHTRFAAPRIPRATYEVAGPECADRGRVCWGDTRQAYSPALEIILIAGEVADGPIAQRSGIVGGDAPVSVAGPRGLARILDRTQVAIVTRRSRRLARVIALTSARHVHRTGPCLAVTARALRRRGAELWAADVHREHLILGLGVGCRIDDDGQALAGRQIQRER